MDGLGGFELGLVDEANALSRQIQEHSAGPIVPEVPGAAQALDLRNRVGALLLDRMQQVRSAARFVFRRNPELVREVTSTYERRKRRASRRAKEEALSTGESGEHPAVTESEGQATGQ
jgi:hypothetical protein